MIRSVPLPSSSASSLLFEGIDLPRSRSSRTSSTVCCSKRSDAYIPKLEPFSRSRTVRGVKEPSFIQKSENELSDYCSTLEGDDSYSCWKAYFELKDLEKHSPKDDVEHLVRQTDGVKSLISCLHGIAAVQKKMNKELEAALKPSNTEEQGGRCCPIPDGLPKTQEELEEEDKARMPDSSFTRLLRSKGKYPAWYSPTPDHETD